MKKKIFTKARYVLALVSLVLLGTNVAVAQTTKVYEYTHTPALNTSNYFAATKNGADVGTYNVTVDVDLASGSSSSITKAVKLESNTTITFTNEDKATVIIGLYARNVNDFKFDGTQYNGIATTTGGYELIKIENVAPGSHTIARGSGEAEVYYVRVTETVSSAIKLADPTILLDQATGNVTITPAENASSTVYTTDGTIPSSDNGISISEETTIQVEDGTIIKAISLGDDENYKNSDIAEATMYLTGITIATPEIKSFNGTFVITCASPNAKIEYSTDGSTYTTYERAITLTEAKTVYAKASRTDCIGSEVATTKVDILPSVNGVSTVYLSYGAFDEPSVSENDHSILKGKSGNAAYGWSIELTGAPATTGTSSTNKAYSEATNCQIVTPNSESGLKAIKLSNGAENTLIIPEGKAVTKLTFYSVINSGSRTSGWKEVGGNNYDVNEIPMGAANSTDGKANPDVRSYNFDNKIGTITFTNAGEQLNFVIAVEYVDILNVEIADEEGYATFSSAYTVAVPEGVTAYGTEKTENNTINLVEITDGVIPANKGVILKGTQNSNYTFKATTETAEVSTVLTANLEDGKSLNEGDYVLGRGTQGIGFYHLASSSTIGANKAYLAAESVAGARVAFIGFGDNTVTAIDAVAAPATAGKAYNLNGVQVAPNAKGVVIMDGKKVVIK